MAISYKEWLEFGVLSGRVISRMVNVICGGSRSLLYLPHGATNSYLPKFTNMFVTSSTPKGNRESKMQVKGSSAEFQARADPASPTS